MRGGDDATHSFDMQNPYPKENPSPVLRLFHAHASPATP